LGKLYSYPYSPTLVVPYPMRPIKIGTEPLFKYTFILIADFILFLAMGEKGGRLCQTRTADIVDVVFVIIVT
jgi:hypothetical protein